MSPPFDDADDLVVIDAYRRDRSERAARELIDRHSPRLLRTVSRVLGDHAGSAEDVLQDAWIRVFRSIATYRAESTFATWVTRIAIRSALDVLRSTHHRVPLLSLDDARGIAGESADRDLVSDIEHALARLTAQMRSVVVLHDIEGWTHAEIAKELDIAVGTSKATLFHARRRLRGLIGRSETDDHEETA